MSEECFEYKCQSKQLSPNSNSLDISITEGLKCSWAGRTTNNNQKWSAKMAWCFDWSALESEKIESFSGHIIVNSSYHPFNQINNPVKFSIEFLSYHSDYFRALFSSNYKEGSLDEITIEKVSFEDFGLLLSTFYPRAVFPNDKTVQKLLELSERFMIPSVIHHVEHHLLHISKIDNESMMWMADKYGMPRLLEKTIRKLDSFEKAKQLEQYEGYSELSKDTKAKLLKRLLQLIRMNT